MEGDDYIVVVCIFLKNKKSTCVCLCVKGGNVIHAALNNYVF